MQKSWIKMVRMNTQPTCSFRYLTEFSMVDMSGGSMKGNLPWKNKQKKKPPFNYVQSSTDTINTSQKRENGVLIHIKMMYVYHALINALSSHMIHINLNTTFYTHVEHSPTRTYMICMIYGYTYRHQNNQHERRRHVSKCMLQRRQKYTQINNPLTL